MNFQETDMVGKGFKEKGLRTNSVTGFSNLLMKNVSFYSVVVKFGKFVKFTS